MRPHDYGPCYYDPPPHEPSPISSIADVLLAVLRQGIVVAVRLAGPPGGEYLMVGFGTPESIDTVLLALGMTTGVFGRHEYEDWQQ